MNKLIKSILYLLSISSFSALIQCQSNKTINVYVDCQMCDMDYIRTEIPFVNYVRDRQNSDVHILVAGQPTGSQGFEIVVYFIGQDEFSGMGDTLTQVFPSSTTEDEARFMGVKLFRKGLFPFLIKMPVSEYLDITYSTPEESVDPVTEDNWNNWVFSLNGDAYAAGQKSHSFINGYGGISATHVTEEWKIKFGLTRSKNKSEFDMGTEFITTETESRNLSAHLIKSISDHFSAGIWSSIYSSTFNNTEYAGNLNPRIEYNIYPYSESTRRQLRLEYGLERKFSHYIDTTIYLKSEEWLSSQSAKLSLELVQPWGKVAADILGTHYLHDFSLNYLKVATRLSLQLVKGLHLNLYGNIAYVHNQVELPASGLTLTDILLQQKQQETDYNYFLSVGFSYSFGAMYNNIVNPRFGYSRY